MCSVLCQFFLRERTRHELNSPPIGCCCKGMIINHRMHTDNLVLFAPSAKGIQKIT